MQWGKSAMLNVRTRTQPLSYHESGHTHTHTHTHTHKHTPHTTHTHTHPDLFVKGNFVLMIQKVDVLGERGNWWKEHDTRQVMTGWLTVSSPPAIARAGLDDSQVCAKCLTLMHWTLDYYNYALQHVALAGIEPTLLQRVLPTWWEQWLVEPPNWHILISQLSISVNN